MLWSAAMEKGYAAPVWMTFKQARELKANVRTGEHGSLVVYADKIIRTEADTVRTRDSFHEGLHGLQCRADRQYAWHVQRNLAIADNYRDFAREIERTVAIVWVPIAPSDQFGCGIAAGEFFAAKCPWCAGHQSFVNVTQIAIIVSKNINYKSKSPAASKMAISPAV
jgi:hypothetical protein